MCYLLLPNRAALMQQEPTILATTTSNPAFRHKKLHVAYGAIFLVFWAYTGLTTSNSLNWVTEHTLTLSMVIFIAAFYNIFRFSDSSYTFIFLFLMLHVYGSQHLYAGNPFGNWLQQTYALQRNPYDRIVHFAFGSLLALPIQEIFSRAFKVISSWSYLLTVQTILALAAVYELVEWLVADLVYKNNAQAMHYLGMQGDIWDAQKDMALAVAGATIAMLALYLRGNQAQTYAK